MVTKLLGWPVFHEEAVGRVWGAGGGADVLPSVLGMGPDVDYLEQFGTSQVRTCTCCSLS